MKKLSFLIAPVAMACMAALVQPAMADPTSADQLEEANTKKLNMNYQADDNSKLLTQFKSGYSEAIGDPKYVQRWQATSVNCHPRKGSTANMKWCILVDGKTDGDIDGWSCYLTGVRGFGNDNKRNADAQIYRGDLVRDGKVVIKRSLNVPFVNAGNELYYRPGSEYDKMNKGKLPDDTDSYNKIWLVVRGNAAYYDTVFTQASWECIKFKRD